MVRLRQDGSVNKKYWDKNIGAMSVRLRVITLTVSLLVSTALGQAQEQAWTIPSCTTQASGKRVATWSLHYVLPKHAMVKKFHDVDWGGFRIFFNDHGKSEVLSLIWGVNDGPNRLCSDKPRVLKLPDGRVGIDARCTSNANGVSKESRNTGVMGEYAYYRDMSSESVKYFDEIIDSMCYQAPKK